MTHDHNVFDPNRVRTAGILIASTKGAAGQREDLAGPMIREKLMAAGFRVDKLEVVADVEDELAAAMRRMADEDGLDLIVTSGGTGPFAERRDPRKPPGR